MIAPVRIQLRRTKGWRMPPNTVKVDRSTRWGNPFAIGTKVCAGTGHARETLISDNKEAVDAFRKMLSFGVRAYPSNRKIDDHLRGKNLACWCPLDQPCHADVLLELANPSPSQEQNS